MAQYADIIEIIAPFEAAQGSQVNITVKIKNTYASAIGVKIVGVPEYEGLSSGLYIQSSKLGSPTVRSREEVNPASFWR